MDTAAWVKRQTRYGVQVRVPVPDLADHYNTVLKMAYKRAIVAATLCLPLVSELFTQDIEEHATPTQSPTDRSTEQRPRRRTPSAQPQTTAPLADAAPMSQQLKQLWSRIKQHDVDYETFRDYLKQIGIQSTKELTPTQLEQCFSEIDTRQAQAFQPHDNTDAESDAPTSGTRAQLFEALTMLQAGLAETEANQPPGEPHAQALIELAQWIPRVARACENPGTPEEQLKTYLLEVQESLDQLQKMAVTEAVG